MTSSTDDRSPMSQAMAWSSRITTISLEMVLPGMIGLWIDRVLGTVMVFLVLGVVLGVTAGMYHLVRMAKSFDTGNSAQHGVKATDKP